MIMRRLRIYGGAAIALVVLIAATKIETARDSARIGKAKRLGTTVVAAIRSFKADNGQFPASLIELVPQYLPAIKAPQWGTGKWKYYGNVGEGKFQLSVCENADCYPELYFHGDMGSGSWTYDT